MAPTQLSLSKAERLVLGHLAKKPSACDLLRLRRETRLSPTEYAFAVQGLEAKGLIEKAGLTAVVSRRAFAIRAAVPWLFTTLPREGQLKPRSDYLATVRVPQLSVADFFLPNVRSFLGKKRRR